MVSQSRESGLTLSGDVLTHCGTRKVVEYPTEIGGNNTGRSGLEVGTVIGWQCPGRLRIEIQYTIQCRNVI